VKKYILVIDVGTTLVRSIIFDKQLHIVANAYEKIDLIHPAPNHTEQSPLDVYQKTVAVIKRSVNEGGIEVGEIECIGLSTQRATWVAWRRDSGEPLMNMVVWMDRRAIDIQREYKNDPEFARRFPINHQIIQPQNVICTLTHVLRCQPHLRALMEKGELMLGTIDTWIVYKLTKGRVFASNASNASTTRLLKQDLVQWDEDLFRYAGFSPDMFCSIKNEADDYGLLDKDIVGREIPITGMVADQQGALFSQACLEPYSLKSTNGTGAFVTCNVGGVYPGMQAPLSLVAWKLPGQLRYMLEGFLITAGAALEWLKNELGMISSFQEMDEITARTPSSEGVFFSPALSGFRAPLNDPTSRAAFLGLSVSTTRAHCVRAVMESIAFANCHIIEDMRAQLSISDLKVIRLSGGVARNGLLGQMIANIADVKVEKPLSLEASAVSAAQFAGICTGSYTVNNVHQGMTIEKIYEPDEKQQQHKRDFAAWKQAVNRTLDWTF
jgi:glycerol kinase